MHVRQIGESRETQEGCVFREEAVMMDIREQRVLGRCVVVLLLPVELDLTGRQDG